MALYAITKLWSPRYNAPYFNISETYKMSSDSAIYGYLYQTYIRKNFLYCFESPSKRGSIILKSMQRNCKNFRKHTRKLLTKLPYLFYNIVS